MSAKAHEQFEAEFRATVDSFLHWRKRWAEAGGLDLDDEIRFAADISATRVQVRREALRILQMMKEDNDLE